MIPSAHINLDMAVLPAGMLLIDPVTAVAGINGNGRQSQVERGEHMAAGQTQEGGAEKFLGGPVQL